MEEKRKSQAVSSAGTKSRKQNASHQWTSVRKERVNYLSGGWLGKERKDRFVLVRLCEDDSLCVTHTKKNTQVL